MEYIKLSQENLANEHICCAIGDKKHQEGVQCKKDWIKQQFEYNYTFYKLNEKGKVFIEYIDSEGAWTPLVMSNYVYIHCFWVSGQFKGKGHAKSLLDYCIKDAIARKKSGICVLVGAKKAPFLSDKQFLLAAGFKVVDKINEYELMAYTLDSSAHEPKFAPNAKTLCIDKKHFVIYYSYQCPYIINCIKEIKAVAEQKGINIEFAKVDSLQKARELPCVFNNFAVFYDGKFVTHHLLNGSRFEKLAEELSCKE